MGEKHHLPHNSVDWQLEARHRRYGGKGNVISKVERNMRRRREKKGRKIE
jgi:methyl coenzyme M reductase subunit C-like uncharacterized protein (methanogenesis marker protein 7)